MSYFRILKCSIFHNVPLLNAKMFFRDKQGTKHFTTELVVSDNVFPIFLVQRLKVCHLFPVT